MRCGLQNCESNRDLEHSNRDRGIFMMQIRIMIRRLSPFISSLGTGFCLWSKPGCSKWGKHRADPHNWVPKITNFMISHCNGFRRLENLRIASLSLDLRRPGESEKAHGRPERHQGSKTQRQSVKYKEK